MNLDSFAVKLSFYQLGDMVMIFSDRTTVYQRSVPEKSKYVMNDKIISTDTGFVLKGLISVAQKIELLSPECSFY